MSLNSVCVCEPALRLVWMTYKVLTDSVPSAERHALHAQPMATLIDEMHAHRA